MFLNPVSGQEGFQRILLNDHFLCAYITHSSKYAYGKITSVKRHLTSQEVFVLLEGKGTVLTAQPDWSEKSIVELKKGTPFCVDAGMWHYLAVSEDAVVFVIENSDVTAQNSEEKYLEEPYEILCGISDAR